MHGMVAQNLELAHLSQSHDDGPQVAISLAAVLGVWGPPPVQLHTPTASYPPLDNQEPRLPCR